VLATQSYFGRAIVIIEALKIAKAVGVTPGMSLLLFFVCCVVTWAYWRERKRYNELQEERLSEAREDVKVMTQALIEAKNAMAGFKATLDAIAVHLPRR
jgi:cbb3-type cytochrome oxidase subunit 3